MALRDHPGQQVHRALSTLRNIETDELPTADTHRLEMATMLLSDVSIRADISEDEATDDIKPTRTDPVDR